MPVLEHGHCLRLQAHGSVELVGVRSYLNVEMLHAVVCQYPMQTMFWAVAKRIKPVPSLIFNLSGLSCLTRGTVGFTVKFQYRGAY